MSGKSMRKLNRRIEKYYIRFLAMRVIFMLQPACRTQYQQQECSADHRLDDFREDSGSHADPQNAEQPSAHNGAQNTNYNRANQSGPQSAYQSLCQNPCDTANHNPNQN